MPRATFQSELLRELYPNSHKAEAELTKQLAGVFERGLSKLKKLLAKMPVGDTAVDNVLGAARKVAINGGLKQRKR